MDNKPLEYLDSFKKYPMIWVMVACVFGFSILIALGVL